MKNLGWMGLCLAGAAFATGGEHGNGGNVLVCEQNGVTTVTLYDYYEWEQRGWQLDLAGNTYEEKLQAAFERIAKYNPTRSALYSIWFEGFQETRSTEFTDYDLVEIPDIGAGTVPPGCHIKTAAQQRMRPLPGDKRYLVDNKLWNLMNETQRAGLVLHEMIYREAALLGHQDSATTRYLNGLFASSIFAEIDYRGYVEYLQELDFRTYDAPTGMPMSLACEPTYHDNRSLESGCPNTGFLRSVAGESAKIRLWGKDLDVSGSSGTEYERVYFRESGTIEKVKIAYTDASDTYGSTSVIPFECPSMKGFFYEVTGFVHLDEQQHPVRVEDVGAIDVIESDGTRVRYGARNGGSLIYLDIDTNGCPVLAGLVRTAE